MRAFVSHSSGDIDLAKLAVELLRTALNLRSDDIRYTSEPGYGLRAGADIEETLRQDVLEADVVIRLLTPNSLASTWVVLELGARWGANKTLIPLCANGTRPSTLKDPLGALLALDCSDRTQLHKLVEDVAQCLGGRLDNPSSYTPVIDRLADAASTTAGSAAHAGTAQEIGGRLSEPAKQLLMEASEAKDRTILVITSMGGKVIRSNGEHLSEIGNPGEEAVWDEALKESVALGLVEDPNGEGQVFYVTNRGYEMADQLRETN